MFFKAFLTNSVGTMCSRIFGFLRDMMMANVLGAGIFSDIFFVAFKLPNLFRRIFAEGAFVQSFLPSFIDARRKGVFSIVIFLIFALVILCLSLLVVVFSGFFTKALAFGFSEATIDLARPIVVINFWYLLLVFITTFFTSLLQYKHIFWVSAYNTALLNIAMICALFLVREVQDMRVLYVLSYGVLVGGVLQILLHVIPAQKSRILALLYVGVIDLSIMLTFLKSHKRSNDELIGKMQDRQKSKIQTRLESLKNDIHKFFTQFFPALLGSSTAQIASFIDTLIASFLPSGAISYLYYANRIFQLPLAIFAIAVSSALFPTIAKAIKNAEDKNAISLMVRSFWLLLCLLGMCVIGGVILDKEIICLLFERGEFARTDTIIVAQVFSAYMIGLLPFGLARIFSLWLYSHKMQGKAAGISTISLFCGTFFSLIFMQKFGVVGLAIGSSLGGFVYFLLNLRIFGFTTFFKNFISIRWVSIFVIMSACEIALLLVAKPFLSRIIL